MSAGICAEQVLAEHTVVDLMSRAAIGKQGVYHEKRGADIHFQSYAILWEQSAIVARNLLARGFVPGRPVPIVVDSPESFLLLLWSCLRARIPVAPMPPLRSAGGDTAGAARLATCTEKLDAPVLCGTAQQAALLERADLSKKGVIRLEDLKIPEREDITLPSPRPGDLAIVQFSSGSTSAPKGICLTHQNILANLADKLRAEDLSRECRIACWFPYYHDFGLFGAHMTALAAGIDEIHMEPIDFARNPVGYLDAIARHRATHGYSTATGARLILRALESARIRGGLQSGLNLSCLELFCLGAEFVPASLCREFTGALKPLGFCSDALRIGYGLAEAVLLVAGRSWRKEIEPYRLRRAPLLEEGRAEIAAPDEDDVLELVDTGKPVATCQVEIRDSAGIRLPSMHVGRVLISGPNVTHGYFRDESATRKVLSGGWLDTGDLGFMTDDGLLVLAGRHKDLIISNGRNILPGDVEEVAREIGRRVWSEVAVVGGYDSVQQRERTALIFASRLGVGQEVNAALLRRAHVAITRSIGLSLDVAIPIRAAEMPRTSSGKIMRYELARRLTSGEFKEKEVILADTQAPETERLAAITNAWITTLELDHRPPGNRDDFFFLGGDSIRAMRLLAKLESIAGGKLPVDFVHLYPTIECQNSALDERGDGLCQNDLETLIRDIAAHAFTIEAGSLAPSEPLMARAGGFEPVLRFAQEIREVFGQTPEVEQALACNSVRDIAAVLSHLEPVSAGAAFELMPFQETLFYHRNSVMRNEPTGLSCYIVYRFDLVGSVDTTLLETALGQIVRRHPMLRAGVDQTGDRPRLRITDAMPDGLLHVEDLTHLDEAMQEARLRQIDVDDHDYRADLSRPPLFYLRAIRRAQRRWVVTMHFDHMLIDGFGLLELSKELFGLYEDLIRGREPAPISATPPFSRYVWLSRLRSLTRCYREDMEHHLKRFSALSPRMTLPMKRNPAMLDDVHFATLHRSPSPELLADLRAWTSSDPDIGMNSLLLAALFKVANVWSGQDDLIINMPLFNREHFLPDARRVVGSFIDIFPIRLVTSFTQPLSAMARKLETEVRSLLARPVSSIEMSRRVAEREHVRGALSSLIFSNSMNLVRPSDLALETLNHEAPPKVHTGAPGTWIDLVLYSVGDRWYLDWNYVRELFDPAFIETLAEQYEAILQDAVNCWKAGTPDRPFSSAAALPPRHRALLSSINDTSAPTAELTVHAEIAKRGAEAPEREALIFEGRKINYRELVAAANQVANALRESDVGPGHFVAISLPRSIDLVVAQLGVMTAGAAYVPIDPAYPADRIGYMVKDCGAHVLIACQQAVERLGASDLAAVKRAILLDSSRDAALSVDIDILTRGDLDAYSTTHPLDRATTSDLAYMIYTSGSTGNPKGTMIEHRSFRNFVDYVLAQFSSRGRDERFALITSPSFDMTLASNWGPLLAGASLHILSEERTRDVEQLARFLAEARISLLNVTPSHFGLLAGALAYMDPLPALDPDMMILLGGEVISAGDCNVWLERFPGHTIVNEYGPTETSVASSFFPIPVNAAGKVEAEVIPIGKPIWNTQMYVLNEERQPCMVGVPGRLFIGGLGVARGYHAKPEQTAAAFIPDFMSNASDAVLYDTGDMARVLEDGNIQFLGRKDRQINLRGYRIELGEIEAHMASIEGISAVAVTPQTDHRGQQILAGFYVLAEGAKVPVQDIRRSLSTSLPEYMIPTAFQALDAMPLTPSGKLDVAALPLATSGERPKLSTAFVAPRTETEARLAEIWQKVLGLEGVGVDDDFWDIGGDSIRAIRLIRAVNDAGYRLTLQEMFRARTVASMATVVGPNNLAKEAIRVPLVPLRKATKPRVELVCLPYAGGTPLMFRRMADGLPADIDVSCAEYPGVSGGEPVGDISQLAADLAERLGSRSSVCPIILLGYCFGGYVAHETARQLIARGVHVRAVIITGATPPGAQSLAYGDRALLGRLDDAETMQQLRRIYDPFLRHMTGEEQTRYWDLFKASVEGMRDYVFPTMALSCPAVVLTGADEEYPLIHDHNRSWSDKYADCAFETIPGGHLMVQTHPAEFVSAIASMLDTLVVQNAVE